MKDDSKKFLYDLLNTPSPTGFEERIQDVVRKRMDRFADSIDTDVHGNVTVAINPKAKRKIMLAGHCDQIGFMVKHISKDGFVYFSRLGGIDAGVCPGSHVTIYGKKGPITGVFGRKPIHHQSGDERSRMAIDLDKFWVDIGAKDLRDAEKRVQVGDIATYKLGVTELGADLISSPGLDDKAGLFVVMEALRICSSKKLDVGLYAVSTVQEEVGLRGSRTAAYAIDPDVGIGVDVDAATDNPGNEDAKIAKCALGAGPTTVRGPNINPVVERMILAAGKKHGIKSQMQPESTLLGNDTNSMQISRRGVATGCVGVPVRYMHTQVELCSYADMVGAAKLIAGFVQDVKAKTDFTPRVLK